MAASAGQGGVSPAVSGCATTFSTGSGATAFSYCISSGGNVNSFKFGGHNDVIAQGTTVEGYGVCHSTASYTDYSGTASGWGAGITTGTPSNFTVTRTSTDGLVKLVQNFTKISTGGVKIKMTITNLSSVTTLTNVVVGRMADFDIIATSGDFSDDIGTATLDAATVYQPNFWGATLAAQSYATPHVTGIDTLGGAAPSGCGSATAKGPVTSDVGAEARYTVGNVKPGKGKTLIFAYTRA
jgi:hypothetical protein